MCGITTTSSRPSSGFASGADVHVPAEVAPVGGDRRDERALVDGDAVQAKTYVGTLVANECARRPDQEGGGPAQGLGRPVHHLTGGPVASHHHEALDASAHAFPGDAPGVARPAGLLDFEPLAERRSQLRLDHVPAAAGGSVPTLRVHHDQCPGRHRP
jgi:hypothetical protein